MTKIVVKIITIINICVIILGMYLGMNFKVIIGCLLLSDILLLSFIIVFILGGKQNEKN